MAGQFIVIDKNTSDSWQYAFIVTDKDGDNKVFDTMIEAQKELDKCQNGVIVGDEELLYDTPTLINEIEEYIKKANGVIHDMLPTESLKIIRTNLDHPYTLLNKIEQWKLILK